jgi:5'-methylthioadenosine phosphorylase
MTTHPDHPATGDERVPVGVIGGSGLYDIEGAEVLEERDVETPFGPPSDTIAIAEIDGRRVAFLPRHGRAHQHNPSSVPYRANIWALKRLGVFWLVTVSAVGSLRAAIEPGDLVVPDQIIDKTFRRPNTLFDEIAVHVGLGEPYEPRLREVLLEAASDVVGDLDLELHDGGTYVCMEGPAFSTKAESHMHRQWGADLIGMTAMPEARLAREAEMAYATLGLPTDWDVWREDEQIDVREVVAILQQSTDRAKSIVERAVSAIPYDCEEDIEARHALETAIMTDPEAIPDSTRDEMAVVLGNYLD